MNQPRLFVRAMIIPALLVLSGCMHIAVKARVKADGSAVVSYRIGLDPKLLSPTPDGETLRVDKDEPGEPSFWDVSDKHGVRVLGKKVQNFPDGRRFTEITCAADSPGAFSDDEESVRWDTTGGRRHLVWAFKCFDAGGTILDNGRADRDGKQAKARAYFARFNFDFEVEMPGKILNSPGADSIRDKKAFFHRTFADLLEKDFTAEATSER